MKEFLSFPKYVDKNTVIFRGKTIILDEKSVNKIKICSTLSVLLSSIIASILLKTLNNYFGLGIAIGVTVTFAFLSGIGSLAIINLYIRKLIKTV